MFKVVRQRGWYNHHAEISLCWLFRIRQGFYCSVLVHCTKSKLWAWHATSYICAPYACLTHEKKATMSAGLMYGYNWVMPTVAESRYYGYLRNWKVLKFTHIYWLHAFFRECTEADMQARRWFCLHALAGASVHRGEIYMVRIHQSHLQS